MFKYNNKNRLSLTKSVLKYVGTLLNFNVSNMTVLLINWLLSSKTNII